MEPRISEPRLVLPDNQFPDRREPIADYRTPAPLYRVQQAAIQVQQPVGIARNLLLDHQGWQRERVAGRKRGFYQAAARIHCRCDAASAGADRRFHDAGCAHLLQKTHGG